MTNSTEAIIVTTCIFLGGVVVGLASLILLLGLKLG